MGHASRSMRNAAPTSASIAELIMLDMIFARTWTGPLGFGVLDGAVSVVRESFGWCLGLLLRKKNPPARLLELDSDRYDASLLVHKCMLLAVNQIVASGCVAQ